MFFDRLEKSQFKKGDKVLALANHPPEVESGAKATIVSPHFEYLYAVQLPDGELHRWFAGSELQSLDKKKLKFGDKAKVINTEGHPPKIKKGMIVKIVKIIRDVPFYDLILENGKYHRWLAEFEIIPRI